MLESAGIPKEGCLFMDIWIDSAQRNMLYYQHNEGPDNYSVF